MYIDLHMHTTASDGAWTRSELLDLLAKYNITTFAVTDHDTTQNSQPMISEAEARGMHSIPGVEISTLYDREYHITSYGIDFEHSGLQSILSHNREERDTLNRETVRLLSEQDARIDFEQYESYTYDPIRGGWKSLNFLIDQGIIRDIPGYFAVTQHLTMCVECPPPEIVIQTVKDAGGFPFLAHPNVYQGGELMSWDQLMQWREFGIAGVECYSPSVGDLSETNYYIDFCKQNNLLISGGSDYHGPFLDRPLGDPLITRDMLDLGGLI